MTPNINIGNRSECLSVYALDRANFFPVEGETAEHLARCPACRKRQQSMRAAALQFESQVYPQTEAAVIKRVLEEQARLRPPVHKDGGQKYRRFLGGLIAAAAIAIFMLSVLPLKSKRHRGIESHSEDAASTYLGDKGAAGLEVYCKRGDQVFRVHQGMTLLPEDMIRFVPVLSKDDPRFLMVISVDNNGTVSRYFPQNSEEAVLVDGQKTPLPGSTVLDHTSGPERIWLLSAKERFQFSAVRDAVTVEWQKTQTPEGMDTLPLPPPIEQTGIVFWKGKRP